MFSNLRGILQDNAIGDMKTQESTSPVSVLCVQRYCAGGRKVFDILSQLPNVSVVNGNFHYRVGETEFTHGFYIESVQQKLETGQDHECSIISRSLSKKV